MVGHVGCVCSSSKSSGHRGWRELFRVCRHVEARGVTQGEDVFGSFPGPTHVSPGLSSKCTRGQSLPRGLQNAHG